MEQKQYNNIPEEQEIDLVELIQKMWINRGLIIKSTALFMVVGLLVAIFSSKVYTASCDVVPQSSSSGSSRVSSLAALAGINLGQAQDVKALSPLVYENIMKSATFRKELMQTKVDFQKAGRPVSFFEYYTSEEFNKPSVADYVVKYTIGLPFVILNAIRGDKPEPSLDLGTNDGPSAIETLTKDEYRCMARLSESVGITLDDKKGYVTITANMPEAVAAAQMAQATLTLLQRYITEFKIEKVQSNLDFVQERYDEAKQNFEEIQARRAKFRDANMNTSRYSARTELEKLDAEYSLAMNLYSELATQLEQAKISVKETTPILTVINPVTVPHRKSKPQRAMILFAFTFLGAVLGMGCVLVLPTLAEITGSEKMKRLVKDVPTKEQSDAEAV